MLIVIPHRQSTNDDYFRALRLLFNKGISRISGENRREPEVKVIKSNDAKLVKSTQS